MMGPFLLLLGVLLIYISALGKSSDFVNAMFEGTNVQQNIRNKFDTTGVDIGAWLKENLWDNISKSLSDGIKGILPFGGGGTTNSTNQSVGSSSDGTSLFNVPIIGADGTVGVIQVVAHDAASAVNNANQGGNTPTGDAAPAG